MFIVMIAVLLIYFVTSGFFNTSAPLKDVCSLSKATTLEESDSWSFYIPEKAGYNPYLVYKKEGSVAPKVSGVLYYEIEESKLLKKEIHESIKKDRHFFVGEKRWIFSGLSILDQKNIVKYYFRVQWEPISSLGGKFKEDLSGVETEYFSSGNLTEEEKAEATALMEEWNYSRPFGFPLLE